MWHYFTVVDSYTGLNRRFRWREAVCDYCGVDHQFQMYDGMCGRWISMRDFVDLADGFETTVRACEEIDDSVVTFKSALTRVLEFKYGDCDFDFICCGVKNGVGCYVVTIDDFVW